MTDAFTSHADDQLQDGAEAREADRGQRGILNADEARRVPQQLLVSALVHRQMLCDPGVIWHTACTCVWRKMKCVARCSCHNISNTPQCETSPCISNTSQCSRQMFTSAMREDEDNNSQCEQTKRFTTQTKVASAQLPSALRCHTPL